MKNLKKIIIVLFLPVLLSCDPMSQYLITAENEPLVVTTYPSLYNINCNNKINSEKCKYLIQYYYQNNKEVYLLKKNQSIQIYNIIGGGATINQFPIDSIKIKKGNIEIKYIGKERIMSSFHREFKSMRITYELIP